MTLPETKTNQTEGGPWVDMLRLAQHFDLSRAQICKRLRDMGFKRGASPTEMAMQLGIARWKPEIRGRWKAARKAQWHLSRGGEAMKQAGLVELDAFSLFCRINGDMAHEGLRAVSGEPLPLSAPNWFITHQISIQLERVPGGRLNEFVDNMVERLVRPRRGSPIDIGLVHAMLDVLGVLDGHRARRSALGLVALTAAPSGESIALHRL